MDSIKDTQADISLNIQETYQQAKLALKLGVEYITEKLLSMNKDAYAADVILWTEKLGKMVESLKSIDALIQAKDNKKVLTRGGIVPNIYENPRDNF